jgi:hypothetical protein
LPDFASCRTSAHFSIRFVSPKCSLEREARQQAAGSDILIRQSGAHFTRLRVHRVRAIFRRDGDQRLVSRNRPPQQLGRRRPVGSKETARGGKSPAMS